MLRLIIDLLLIALITALLGSGGIAGAAAGIAKIVFLIALNVFVISLLFKLFKRAWHDRNFPFRQFEISIFMPCHTGIA